MDVRNAASERGYHGTATKRFACAFTDIPSGRGVAPAAPPLIPLRGYSLRSDFGQEELPSVGERVRPIEETLRDTWEFLRGEGSGVSA
jgi:hypothetical protein